MAGEMKYPPLEIVTDEEKGGWKVIAGGDIKSYTMICEYFGNIVTVSERKTMVKNETIEDHAYDS